MSEFLFCIGSNRRAVFVIMCASLLMLTRKAFMLLADAPCLENHWLIERNRQKDEEKSICRTFNKYLHCPLHSTCCVFGKAQWIVSDHLEVVPEA